MDINRLNIIEHYKHPSNFGKPKEFTHTSSISNLSCGDEITIYLLIKDNIIKDVKFEGSGCSISIATMSMLTELLLDANTNKINSVDLNFIQNQILKTPLSSGRYKCASIGIEALKKAISIQ